jgi:outer membrane protein
MKNTAPLFLSIFLLVIVFTTTIYFSAKSYKIAYVRTAELVYGYNGMREARIEYKSQVDAWQANVDTLRVQYQKCLSDYQNSYKHLSESEKEEKQLLIRKLEDNLKNYSTVIKQQAQEKEGEMTEAVLNQINSYVASYAQENGYDYIIGSSNGTLLYAKDAHDITEEVLKAINGEYKIVPSGK